MIRIAIIDHDSHTLYVDEINDKVLQEQYGGEEQNYIDDNYSLGNYSWDYIVDAQYFPEGESTPMKVYFL